MKNWVTDVTEFALYSEKIYLSPILDLHSSRLVSYVISERSVLSIVMNILDAAARLLPLKAASILHSDQGWQYHHKQYQRKLAKYGIIQSMSRKGNCLDNAVMDNFWGLLKSKLIEYLDYYNNHRIKAKLKGLSPATRRQQALSAA